MTTRTLIAAVVATIALLTVSGCAVKRGQESTGAYIDDTVITTEVKSRFVDSKNVAVVQHQCRDAQRHRHAVGLRQERRRRRRPQRASPWKVKGVKSVKNEIAVRP